MYCRNTNANFEMDHQALQNIDSQASSYQQQIIDFNSSWDENIMNGAITTTPADNFIYGPIGQDPDLSIYWDDRSTDDIISKACQAALVENQGLTTENCQARFYQQQILESTSNLNEPAKNGAIPTTPTENLIFQMALSQNLESYGGIGEDPDLNIYWDDRSTDDIISEACQAALVEHQGLTTENSQASVYQQEILDSTSNLNVPATNGTILIKRNPNLQTASDHCLETSKINQNTAQDLNFTNSLGALQLYKVIYDEAGNATLERVFIEYRGLQTTEITNANSYPQQRLDSMCDLDEPITNDLMYDDTLPKKNSNLLMELDQNIQAIEIGQGLDQRCGKPITNDIRYSGTNNGNFQTGVIEHRNLATMENIPAGSPEQRSLDLKCGDTKSPTLQTELTQRQYVQIVQTNQVSYCHSSFDFTIESNRLKSLLSWINKHVSKEKLARFGFFYNRERDYVECSFCKVVIGGWGLGDDPLMEHFKHSPDCNLLNLKCTENVPNDEMLLKNELNEMQESFKRMQLKVDLMPRHPYYKDENKRLQSFANWPKSLSHKKEDLSAAGFFYLNSGDDVKCFDCGGCLTQWEETDVPIEEHKQHFGNKCQFIQKNYSRLKRKRPYNKDMSNATPIQTAEMLNFMNEHTDLKEGKLHLQDKQLFVHLWEDLTILLNNLDGPYKPIDGWKKTWHDWKSNNQKKIKTSLNTSQILLQLPSPVEPERAAESRLKIGNGSSLPQNLQLQLEIQKMENQRLQHEIHILKLQNELDNLKRQSEDVNKN